MKKTILLFLALTVSIMVMSFASVKEKKMKDKKVKTFVISKEMPLPADKVWEVVANDYGRIAHSHPSIIESEYIDGSLKGKEGAERICYFNESHTQYLKEKMLEYDSVNMQFTNQVFQAGKFPVDPDLTRAVYKITPLTDNTCIFSFDMQYRTKPAFMGGMMKKKFEGMISDYFIAIEHHVKTGESVTKENFKQIKKLYVAK